MADTYCLPVASAKRCTPIIAGSGGLTFSNEEVLCWVIDQAAVQPGMELVHERLAGADQQPQQQRRLLATCNNSPEGVGRGAKAQIKAQTRLFEGSGRATSNLLCVKQSSTRSTNNVDLCQTHSFCIQITLLVTINGQHCALAGASTIAGSWDSPWVASLLAAGVQQLVRRKSWPAREPATLKTPPWRLPCMLCECTIAHATFVKQGKQHTLRKAPGALPA